jgi:hypothetical protein
MYIIGVPLCICRKGRRLAIGTFCIMDTEPRNEFSESDREILSVMGAAIISKIETSARPWPRGPLASPWQDGGISMRVKVLQKCTAIVARQVSLSLSLARSLARALAALSPSLSRSLARSRSCSLSLSLSRARAISLSLLHRSCRSMCFSLPHISTRGVKFSLQMTRDRRELIEVTRCQELM